MVYSCKADKRSHWAEWQVREGSKGHQQDGLDYFGTRANTYFVSHVKSWIRKFITRSRDRKGRFATYIHLYVGL